MLRLVVTSLTMFALAACLAPIAALGHGGGLDGQGGHHNRKAGGYHLHRGPLAGQHFATKQEAAAALAAHSKDRAQAAPAPAPAPVPAPAKVVQPKKVLELECSELIARAAAGEDFSRQELILTGTALNDTEDGLVNIGTQKTYESDWYENIVSVLGVPRSVRAGTKVRFAIKVEACNVLKSGAGDPLVTIDADFVQ